MNRSHVINLPEELPPVESQVFYEIMMRLSQVVQSGKRLPAEMEVPEELAPDQRSLWCALTKRFPAADPMWVLSLTWRLIALSDLIASGALDDWVISEGGGEMIIPDDVVEAASRLPLARGQPFNAREFLAELSGDASA